MTKRILSLFLCVVMLLSMFPSAYADEGTVAPATPGEEFTQEITTPEGEQISQEDPTEPAEAQNGSDGAESSEEETISESGEEPSVEDPQIEPPAETEQNQNGSEDPTTDDPQSDPADEPAENSVPESIDPKPVPTAPEAGDPQPDPADPEAEDPQPILVTFTCDPEGTVVTVYDSEELDVNGDPLVIEAEEDGGYLLMPGEYLYDAECEGYESVEKASFTVTEETSNVTVTLAELPEVPAGAEGEPVRVVFACEPKETEITVFDGTRQDENGDPVVIKAEEDGSYLLMPGEYLYDAECEGYESVEKASFTVTEETSTVTVTLAELPEVLAGAEGEPVRVVFACEPKETEITVFDGTRQDENGDPVVIKAEEDGSYLLMPGEYLYDAECEGYESVEKAAFSVTDEKAEVSIDIELRKAEEIPFQFIKPEFPETEGQNNEELFDQYANSVLYPGSTAPGLRKAKAQTAGSRLTGYDRTAYNVLTGLVANVANGSIRSTDFNVSLSELGISKTSFTPAELGLSSFGHDVNDLYALIGYFYDSYDTGRYVLYDSLLMDLPYDLYWHDQGAFYIYPDGGYTSDGKMVLEAFHFVFYVAREFSATNATNTTETNGIGQSVTTAKQTAQSIVSSYSGRSDYEKLKGYANEICSRVEYNWDAVEDDNVDYGNPWQLIWVFDGDTSTNVVCEGYAKAFMYLCELTSFNSSTVRCIQVRGDIGGGHRWNIVRMEDGKNYIVDLTNNDAGSYCDTSYLFLSGHISGSVSSGYYYRTGSSTTLYTYRQDGTLNVFSTSDLETSGSDYVPGQTPPPTPTPTPTPTPGPTDYYTITYHGMDYDVEEDIIHTDTFSGGSYTIGTHYEKASGILFSGYSTAMRRSVPDFQPGETTTVYGSADLYPVYVDLNTAVSGEPVIIYNINDFNSSGYTVTQTTKTVTTSSGASKTFPAYIIRPEVVVPTPVLSSISNETGGVKITWNPVDGASKYYIYRKNGSSWNKIAETSNTNYTDANVSSGTYYTYTVRAILSDGSMSGYSSTGKSITFIAAPIISSVENSNNGILIKWNAINSASKYRVFRRIGNGAWSQQTETSSTSYTDTSVNGGTAYTYTIRAVGNDGNTLSGFDPVGKTITYLAKIVITSLENVNGGVKVSWSAGTGASKYYVFRRVGNGAWTKIAETANTAYTDPNVNGGTTYTYTVRSVGSNGSTVSVMESTGRSILYIPQPTISSLENASGGILIKWNAVNGAAKYYVFRRIGNGAWNKMAETANTSFTDDQVNGGTAYTYTIRAIGTDGSTVSSYDPVGKTITYLAKVLYSSIENVNGGVKLTWSAGTGASKYYVFRRVGSGAWSKVAETANNTFIDSNVNGGTVYTYTVRSVGDDGSTVSVMDNTGKTIQYIPQPAVSSVENVSGGILIKWNAANGAAKYYVLRRIGNGAWAKMGETANTSFTDDQVNGGTAYTYTIRAVGTDGSSLSSFDAAGKTITYLAKIAVTSLENVSGGVKVTWSAGTGASKYYVFRRIGNGAWAKMAETANTTFTDAQVNGGTAYTYTVRSVGSDGSTVSVFDSTGRSIVYIPLVRITGAENQIGAVRITWSTVNGAAKYRIYKKIGSGSWNVLTDVTGSDYTDTSVGSGKAYSYSIRGIADNGSDLSAFDSTGRTITYISAPVVSGADNTLSGVRITWNAVAGATHYRVFRKSGSGSWETKTTTTVTYYTDTSVASGSTYTYAVRCVSSDGKTYISAFNEKGKTITFIEAPILQDVFSTGDGVRLYWSASTGAAKYRVLRKTEGGSWQTIADTANTTFTDASAVSGTTYIYSVRCVDSSGSSYTSGYDSNGRTITFSVVATPTIQTIANVVGGVQITWNAPAGAEKYYVLRKTGIGAWTKVAETYNTTFTDSKVNGGTTYTYTIRCVSTDGSYYTSVFNTAGKSILYIPAPIISSVENALGGVFVKWSPMNGAAKYYVLRRIGNGAWTKMAETANTSFTDDKVNGGTAYTYTIRAVGSDGSTVSGYDSTGKTITYLAKVPVTSLENVNGGVRVNWSAGTGASKYYVLRKIGNGSWTKVAETANNTFIDAKVNGGTTYTYTVRSVGNDGSTVSAQDNTGRTILYIPQPKVSAAAITSGGIQITWNAVNGASKYHVLRRTGTGNWTKIAETSSSSFTDANAANGTTYSYTVRGVSSDGKTMSAYDTTDKTLTYLTQVSITSVQNVVGGVRLSWNSSAGAEKYYVYRKVGSGEFTKINETKNTSFTDANVSSGTTYTYSVRTVAAGTGTLSPMDNIGKSINYIAAPVINSILSTGDGVKLIWNACEGAAKYRVLRRESGGTWSKIVDTSNTFFTDAKAVNGTTYYYTVCCITADGASVTSSFDNNGKSIKVVILDVPVIQTIQNAQGGVQLTWNAPEGAEKYFVLRKTGNGAWTKMAETTNISFTDARVNSGATYTYTVRCVDATGTYYTSPFNSNGKTITYLAMINITGLENVKGGVQVRWSALNGAAKYYVFRRIGNGAWTKMAETVNTSFIDAKVNGGTTYTYTVRCVGEDGSTVSYFDTIGKTITYVPAPVITNLSNVSGGIQVKWSAVAGASRYAVLRKTGGSATWTKVADTTNTMFTDAHVASGQAYTYTVCCISTDGSSYISGFDSVGKTIVR